MDSTISTGAHDKHGRPVMVGDVLKVYHFTAARNRKVYMYKLVADVPGLGFRAVCVIDLATKGIQAAHSCSLHVLGDFEVVDGPFEQDEKRMTCWWERKRVNQ